MGLLFAAAFFAQLAASTQQTLPVLAFPEAGMDDPAAYQGYQTRFFRDATGNTVQIYIDARAGRVVHLWANAENESIGFTARNERGAFADLRWKSAGAEVAQTGRARTLEYSLTSDARRIDLGWFLWAPCASSAISSTGGTSASRSPRRALHCRSSTACSRR